MWRHDWDTINKKTESLRELINKLAINDMLKKSMLEDLKAITRKLVKTKNENNKRNDNK
jgi:hypothetical protein